MEESKGTEGDVETTRTSRSPSPVPSTTTRELSPAPSAPVDKPESSPITSRGSTPEKRSSSERETSSEREKSVEPEKLSDTEKPSDTKEKTPDKKEKTPEKKEKSSTDGKEKSHSKPEQSTSSSGDKKRKLEMTEEEMKQEGKKQHKQQEDRMKMHKMKGIRERVLVSNFSEEQLNRYEMFRRATFPKAAIKRLMTNLTGTNVSQNVVIAMSGISKVFVGEVMETALDVMEKWGESGPLQPKHLREAVRILRTKNMIPSTKSKTSFF